jgi:hypothetical protein
MKRIVTQIIGTLFPMLSAVHAQAQARRPTPPAELRKLDVWIGSWELSGTARDQPADPEYNLHWQLHEHWILDGFFMQVDQTWEGGGQSTHALELLSYDQGKKIYADSGFASDGSTWSLTATFRGSTMIERGETLAPDGTTTRCRMTWVFSDDGMSVSGTEECDKSGVRWKAVEVKGTKSGLPR